MPSKQDHSQAANNWRTLRHTDQLPTEEARNDFVEKTVVALHAWVHAMLDIAYALLKNPEEMLNFPFMPNIIGMHPNAIAAIECTHFKDGDSVVIRAVVDGREVAIKIAHVQGNIAPVMDDSFGC